MDSPPRSLVNLPFPTPTTVPFPHVVLPIRPSALEMVKPLALSLDFTGRLPRPPRQKQEVTVHCRRVVSVS